MANDLLEKLAQGNVPPVPENLHHQIHDSLNRSLLASHLVDFACRALPRALLEFARAWGALMVFTLTGQMPGTRRRASQEGTNRDRPQA